MKNVLVLAGGTVLAQLFILLLAPLLTRLFTPEDFGELAIFTSLVAIFSTLATLSYEFAIPLCKSNRAAFNLASCCLVLVFIISPIAVLSLYLTFQSQVVAINFEDGFWGLLLMAVIVYSIFKTLNYVAIKQGQFKNIATAELLQQISGGSTQVLFGLSQLGASGLIVGLILGKIVGISRLIRKTYFVRKGISIKRMMSGAKRNVKFPLFFLWASLINLMGIQAAPLIFTFYFNLHTAGFIALTMKVLGVPSALVGHAIGKVFYNRAVMNTSNVDNKLLVEKLICLLFLIGFPVFIVIFIYGADIFTFVFGAEWRVAGEFAQYLSPYFFLSLIASPLSSFALVKFKQKKAFYITIYETVSRLAVLIIGAKYFGINTTVILYSIVGVIISIIYILWILHLSGSGFLMCLNQIKGQLIASAIFVCFLIVIKQYFSIETALVFVFLGTTLYYIYSIYFNLKQITLGFTPQHD